MELPRPVPTDVELLRDAERDPEAFGELFRRHAPSVHAWLAHRLEWAASDLTAETFARAWLSRRRFEDHRDGSLRPWLLGIAKNVLRDSVRRDRVETAARERLGLPLDLATEDGYTAVEERLSPRVALARPWAGSRPPSATRWSSACSTGCPTRRWPSGWASSPPPRACASRAGSATSPPADIPQEER